MAAWVLGAGTGCRPPDRVEQIRREGVLRVAYAVEAPYAYIDARGVVTGEAPEIARRIASRLNLPVIEWRLVEFGLLLEGLEAGRYDVVAAGMFVTPERRERATFSRPTLRARPALLMHRERAAEFTHWSDVPRHPTARIAVLTGSVEEKLLRQSGRLGRRLVSVPHAEAGRALVENGEADALALSLPTLREMTRRRSVLEVVELHSDPSSSADPTPALCAFAFRRGDVELQRAWDDALADFLGSPEHLALLATWGLTTDDLP